MVLFPNLPKKNMRYLIIFWSFVSVYEFVEFKLMPSLSGKSAMWLLCCASGAPMETHVHSDIFQNNSLIITTWKLLSSATISSSFIMKFLLSLGWTISFKKKNFIFSDINLVSWWWLHLNIQSTLNKQMYIQIKLALQ